jgi:hypothetical protein
VFHEREQISTNQLNVRKGPKKNIKNIKANDTVKNEKPNILHSGISE